MSLINDALQRAKTVQQINPPAVANLPLRPIEPAQQEARGPGLVLPVILATILLGGIATWWLLSRTGHTAKTPETTPTVAASAATAPIVSSPAPAPGPATIAPAAAPDKASEPTATMPTRAVEPAAPPTTASVPAHEAATVNETVTTAEVAKPAPLKLQAITFNPARPSAIVSGKTVYVGDRFREFRVVKIDADSATLVNGTQTNVLTMD